MSFSQARLALRAPSVRVKTMGAETVAKSCAFCGIDVSGKPRTKDAQGRYACADCVKKATAVKARADAAAKGIDIAKANTPPNKLIEVQKTEDVDSVLDGLIAKSAAQTGTPCPQCNRFIPTHGMICTGCGFNRDTGKVMRTRIVQEPKPREDPGLKRRGSIAVSPGAHALIALVFLAGPIAAGAMLPSVPLFFIGIGLWALYSLCTVIMTIVAGFRMSVVTGTLLIVSRFVPVIGDLYWLYFILVEADSDHLKMAYFVSFLVYVGCIFIAFADMIPK